MCGICNTHDLMLLPFALLPLTGKKTAKKTLRFLRIFSLFSGSNSSRRTTLIISFISRRRSRSWELKLRTRIHLRIRIWSRSLSHNHRIALPSWPNSSLRLSPLGHKLGDAAFASTSLHLAFWQRRRRLTPSGSRDREQLLPAKPKSYAISSLSLSFSHSPSLFLGI